MMFDSEKKLGWLHGRQFSHLSRDHPYADKHNRSSKNVGVSDHDSYFASTSSLAEIPPIAVVRTSLS